MLSICIPVYNYNVTRLVQDLHKQADRLGIDFEIIVIDDFSDPSYKAQNTQISVLRKIRYLELPGNIGRSKIRNLFIRHAQFENLLFLDCDASIISDDFIKTYIDELSTNGDVICGGLCYQEQRPQKDFLLRWKYGRRKEVMPLEKRLKNPYNSFKTINFLTKKDVFEKIQFDERISGYGHEDTLFGFELKNAGITISHINNPVMHNQLETNQEFLKKTNQSIANLLQIRSFLSDTDFDNSITLLKAYNKLKKVKALFLCKGLFFIFRPVLYWLLKTGVAGTKLLAFYKLGLLVFKMD